MSKSFSWINYYFQFWWATIWEQSFIEKGIAKYIYDFRVFLKPFKKITLGSDSSKAFVILFSSSHLQDPKKMKKVEIKPNAKSIRSQPSSKSEPPMKAFYSLKEKKMI